MRHPDRDHRHKAGDDKQSVIPGRSEAEGKGIHTSATSFSPPLVEREKEPSPDQATVRSTT
jgi:hypothetical protein